LVVRLSAANQLVERGGKPGVAAVKAMMSSAAPAVQRVHGLWVLERMGALESSTLLACAADPDRALRVHSLKVLVDRPALVDREVTLAPAHLTDADPVVRRAAAEVLSAHPMLANIKPLIALRRSTPADDTHLIHVARMALRDQLLTSETWSQLGSLSLSEQDRRDIADVATGVHTEGAARFLLDHLTRTAEPIENVLRFVHHIARYGANAWMPEVVKFAVSEKRPAAERLALLKGIQQGAQERGAGLDEPSRKLATALARQLLSSAHAGEVGLGIDVVRDFGFRDMQPELKRLVQSADVTEDSRIHALGALTVIDPAANVTTVADTLADAQAPMGLRSESANLLGNLDRADAQAALLSAMPSAPEQLQSAIASALVRRREGADALLKAIDAGKASARLLQDRAVTISLESSGLPKVTDRIASLLKGLPPADQKLSALYNQRREGFLKAKVAPVEGAAIFEKQCAICHQLGGKGAKVGPQLDGIGSRGLDRLMEDILDPNRNVDQTFRVTNLALRNGQIVSGLLLREEGEVLIVADAQGKEIRVPKSSVEERASSPLSPMPANLSDQIAERDFYRLMAYLLTKRDERAVTGATPAPTGTR
jgi:putative heme-binding domain-containing protein